MDIYKGYLETVDKKPKKGFKDGKNLVSLDWARRFNEYAGVLAPGVALIDVDDEELANILLRILDGENIKTLVYETNRGMHFLFWDNDELLKTNKTHTQTAVGLTVDIKLGTRNSYHVLKYAGTKRQVLRKVEELAVLPKWLTPIKSNVDFTHLEEGDGRNQALFNYILTLQSEEFTKAEIIETIGIINKYVLKSPLDQREIDIILRDEAFKKQSFITKKGFKHQDFAKFLVRENHIIRIDNVLHIYKDGIYVDKQRDIEITMIRHIPELTQSQRREVLSYLELVADFREMSVPNYMALGNGIYDFQADELQDYNPEIIIKNRVPVNYRADAYDPTVDKTLNKICCQDPELRMLLEEVVGYMLLRRNELGKFFVLTGTGSNGKSTFIDMLKNFLTSENYSSLALKEIDQRFKTAEVFGKLANLGDDISNQYIKETDVLKKLVTGETVTAERKGKDPFQFDSYAKLVFSANDMPRINDLSEGLKRRLVIVPFNAKFSDTDADFDPYIKDKIKSHSSMQYLLRIGIDGLKRVLAANKFTKPSVVKQALVQYEVMNNPVLGFIEEGNKINNELSRDVYLRYNTWCHENGLKPLSHIVFSREVCKHGFRTKAKKIEGKTYQIFMRCDG